MKRRMRALFAVGAALVAWTAAVSPGGAGADAQGSAATSKSGSTICVVHSNPSMVESGLATEASSVADIVLVECQPVYSEDTVTIDASQLNNACHGTLSWASPPSAPSGSGAQFTVTLDDDGNATAALWGGPSCAAGTYRISASLNVPPFTTVKTSFTVIAPQNTTNGVFPAPKSEVEDATTSSVATVFEVEFPSVQAEKTVIIKSDELDSRCGSSLKWYGPDEVLLATGPEATVTLDDNGNAFAVLIAGPSCASGTSSVTADLTTAPYTTHRTYFTILSPRSTVPGAASIQLEKAVCAIRNGSDCTSPNSVYRHSVSVARGTDVLFRIIITNTGKVTLTDITTTDAAIPDCAGPVVGSLAAGSAVRYFCGQTRATHSFTNTASATGTTPTGSTVTSPTSSATVDVT